MIDVRHRDDGYDHLRESADADPSEAAVRDERDPMSPGLMGELGPSDRWAGWTIPTGYIPESIGLCRGCRAQILWCITPRDRRSPHDRDGVSHFATCPEARRFRR